MRKLMFVTLLGALVFLTGCAEVGMFLNPPHAYINAPNGRWIKAWSTPRLEYADMNGGWIQVWGSYIEIPGNLGSQRFRLVPGGRCISAGVEYDGRLTHRLSGGRWQFGIPNYSDGGNHELRIYFTVQEPGQQPIPDTLSYLVYNGYGGR